MNPTQPTSLREEILHFLQFGPVSPQKIFEHINTLRDTNISKQGFYKSLRKLRDEHIIIWKKQLVSINTQWLAYWELFIQTSQANLETKNYNHNFLHLAPGDSVTHRFGSILDAVVFWDHAFNLFLNSLPEYSVFFTYVSHDWFVITQRTLAEQQLATTAKTRNLLYLATTGYNTPLDLHTKKIFTKQNPTIQNTCLEKPLNTKPGYNVCIFGDTLVEPQFDSVIAERIHAIYQNARKPFDAQIEKLGELILHSAGKHTVKISHNPRKSHRIKQTLQKNFYIPDNYLR